MKGIRDRVMLGALAGLAGNAVKTAIDEVSLHYQISQRPFRMTASGVWLPSSKQAGELKGQILGGVFDFGLSALGGVGLVYLLTRTGRDHYLAKGFIYGMAFGSAVNAMLSYLPHNRVRPKDAASNLSYLVAHALYGLAAGAVAAHLGHPSLYDTKPMSDYLEPTVTTTEQATRLRRARRQRRRRPQPVPERPPAELDRH